MSAPEHVKIKTGRNVPPREDEAASPSPDRATWKRTILEIAVLLAMFLVAAAFAILPTVYTLWRHS